MWWAFQAEEKNDVTCGTQLRGRGIGGACLIQHGAAVDCPPPHGGRALASDPGLPLAVPNFRPLDDRTAVARPRCPAAAAYAVTTQRLGQGRRHPGPCHLRVDDLVRLRTRRRRGPTLA